MHVIRYISCLFILGGSCLSPAAEAWRMEAGEATTLNTATTDSFVTIGFQNAFDEPPVVVVLPTDEGGDSATMRIQNVTVNGFDVAPIESPGEDGPHTSMTFHYMAVEPGNHIMADGTKIAAGRYSTTTVQGKFETTTGWDLVSFGADLESTASVVATVQTRKSELGLPPSTPSEPLISVATRNATSTSVELALDRAEVVGGTLLAEDIGWIAFPGGENGSFFNLAGASIGWDARETGDTIVGWDNGCTNHTFTGTAWADGLVLASKSSRDGVDGGWLRRCNLSSTTIGLVIDEDIDNDADRSHTTETANLISFSAPFHADFSGEVEAEKTVSMAPGQYSLPGNIVTYTVTAKSVGTLPIDEDAVVFTDILPEDLEFRVVDIDGPGSGPVDFNPGTSTLTYNFVSFSDLTDDLDFSDDEGVTFTYVPSDMGNGTDPNVTHIRVSPKGSFPQSTASLDPSFSLTFDATIK